MQPLSRQDLRKLRCSLRELCADHGGIPFRQLLELASLETLAPGLTLDLEGSRELGHPLVILRPPVRRASLLLSGLSARECEVATLVADGLANKTIAHRLRISVGTVKDHVHRILKKTGLRNRTALTVEIRSQPNAAMPRSYVQAG